MAGLSSLRHAAVFLLLAALTSAESSDLLGARSRNLRGNASGIAAQPVLNATGDEANGSVEQAALPNPEQVISSLAMQSRSRDADEDADYEEDEEEAEESPRPSRRSKPADEEDDMSEESSDSSEHSASAYHSKYSQDEDDSEVEEDEESDSEETGRSRSSKRKSASQKTRASSEDGEADDEAADDETEDDEVKRKPAKSKRQDSDDEEAEEQETSTRKQSSDADAEDDEEDEESEEESEQPKKRHWRAKKAKKKTCGSKWDNCLKNGCCDSGLSCYLKDSTWAQCLPTDTCKPGSQSHDLVKTYWSCDLWSKTQGADNATKSSCTESWGNCMKSQCCPKGFTCYEKTEGEDFAQCRPTGDCEENFIWTCRDITRKAHSNHGRRRRRASKGHDFP